MITSSPMRCITILFTLTLLINCSEQSKLHLMTTDKRTYQEIKSKKKLRVVTINSELSYYENRDGKIEGLDYDMITSFAKSNNFEVELIVKHSIAEALEELKLNKVDIAAANLSVTANRKEDFLFTSSYQKVRQRVICRSYVKPKNIKELTKLKIIIGEDTSYEDILEDLQKKHSELQWIISKDLSSQEIFEALSRSKNEYDCTIADMTIANIYLRYFPKLEIAMKIGKPSLIAWAVAPHLEKLKQDASIWIESAKKQGLISAWKDKYFSHFQDFDRYDLKKFLKRIKTRLPKYKNIFKKYAQDSKLPLDWKLLAAISYQESHWNSKAVSATGVRGLMMLTQNTAKSVGVKDRTDPAQSIQGGAKYIRRLMQDVSKHIHADDHIWVALASYNVGASHVRDARGLAAWEEKNPNRWAGIKAVLPYLSIKKYYRRLPHGFARGLEPVIYVRRIRHYYDLLQRER